MIPWRLSQVNDEVITDIWNTFKNYIDSKQISIAAERFVDTIVDHGVTEETLNEAIGNDKDLDIAICYYLELDEEDWEED